MRTQVLLTGGTGRLGSVLARDLTEAGFDCTVMSTRPGPGIVPGDLSSGAGLQQALQGKEFVIHCASNFNDHENVDVRGTQNLVNSLDRKTVSRIIYVSIVGVEDIPLGYYDSKRKAEKILLASGVPCLVSRFTQFHDFVYWMLGDLGAGDRPLGLLRLPAGLIFQSIAVGDISAFILDVLNRGETGLVEYGGPEVLTLEHMALTYLEQLGVNKELDLFEPQNELHKAFTLGKNTTPNGLRKGLRWSQFLQGQ